jgi:hypothetical protein
MTKDEKSLIEEKFKGLTTLMNAQFTNVHERLDKIETQTTKTNGRVTELEKKELVHIIECPQTPKIEQINKDLNDYRFIIKHPKLIVAGIVMLILLTAATLFSSSLNRAILHKDLPQTETSAKK